MAIRLKSCQDLSYTVKRHESLTSENDEKICGVEKEARDKEQKQTSDKMEGMVQVIQDVTKRVSQFGEDLEKLKCLSTYKSALQEDSEMLPLQQRGTYAISMSGKRRYIRTKKRI